MPEPKISTRPVLEIQDLKVHFPIRSAATLFRRDRPVVKAVDGVSFTVFENEIFGIAGESGCGKSTMARALMRLAKPTSGEILFEGEPLQSIRDRDLRRGIQMVFQDPYGSLNPRRTVGSIVGDPLCVHTSMSRAERREAVQSLLESVGLARDHYFRFPHEFSGGQRQRVAIARALALSPRFLVLDEPTSALDVSVQAVILNLLLTIKEQRNLSCLFITHDLNLMRFMTKRLAVMYMGHIVETGDTEAVFSEPLHPYTKALVASTPETNTRKLHTSVALEGDLPSPVNPPTGCTFHTRCPVKIGAICERQVPHLRPHGERLVACHLFDPPAGAYDQEPEENRIGIVGEYNAS
jgi:oligopeptide/dipeptide ABC transporter ATP-binding protein